MLASPDARLLRRPFHGYRALRDEEPASWWSAAWGVARWLLFVGCFVSWTTSGRLIADHLLFAPMAWAFGPILQGLWIVLAVRAVGGRAPAAQLVTLYFRGHAPWMLLLLSVSGVCLFVADPASVLLSGGRTTWLMLAVGGAMLWCALLTYALFRGACDLGRRRSLLGSAAFYGGYSATLVSWYGITGQLAPILGWVT